MIWFFKALWHDLGVVLRHGNKPPRKVTERSDSLGYQLMAGGSGAPPRSRDPLLDVMPEKEWREIEREARK